MLTYQPSTIDNHKKKKKEKKEKEKTILKDNSKPSLASTMVKVLTEVCDKIYQLNPNGLQLIGD